MLLTMLIHDSEESMAAIFQASDLSRKRREVLEAARHGQARIRDTDGTSLVMIPEDEYRLDKELAGWGRQLLSALAATQKSAEARSVLELGELAWLEVFDDEDLQEFFREATEAFARAASEQRLDPLETTLEEWRVTARALADDRRRSVLLGQVHDPDFSEVSRPAE